MRNLTKYDIVAIALFWTGGATVSYFSKDEFIILVALGLVYYLCKWVILKEES